MMEVQKGPITCQGKDSVLIYGHFDIFTRSRYTGQGAILCYAL
jgi:hypothetical protein